MTTETLERERVLRRFAEAAAYPVTLVIAPAGYGKSVALAQYAPHAGPTVVRYDVRADEGSLHAFVRGLALALHAVAPDADATVADAIAASRAATDPVAALASWLGEHLANVSGAIVIDGFHHTDADPACAKLLSALVDASNSGIRWIVAARTARHLPIGSWLVYGQAAIPIDEGVLRFTREEARAAAGRISPALGERDVDRLCESTGGWATALRLSLALAAQSADLQSALTAARSLSFDYLALHVYGSLSDRERELLMVGTLLPEFDVAMLERAEFDDAAMLLEGLQRRVTFLSPALEESGTLSARRYRCDELFRDFLAHAFELEDEAKRADAYRRAAGALESANLDAQALALFVRAGTLDDALRVLASRGFALIDAGHEDTVDAALVALAGTAHAGEPLVVGLRATLEYAAGHYERARVSYERAIASCTGDRLLAAMLTAKLGTVLVNLGMDPRALLERVCFDASLPVALRGELLSLLVVGRARFGPHENLDRLIDEVEMLALELDGDSARVLVLHALGSAAVLLGDAVRANRILTGAAALATRSGMFRLASSIYTNLASNAVEEGDFTGALAASERALELAIKSGQLFLARYALSRQIDIEVHRGDEARLEELLHVYGELPGPEHPRLAYVALWARAMLAAWRGRFDEAARMQKQLCAESAYQEERIVVNACCALFLALTGAHDEAAQYASVSLEEGLRKETPRPAFYREREIARSLCALAEGFAGRLTAASRILQDEAQGMSPQTRAMREAAASIVRNAELGVAPPELGVHLETMNAGGYGGYARLIESAIRRWAGERATGVTLAPAELAVLRRLASGETPKEIARANGCSIHTIRWHIRRAISKFGCSGQEQALRAAHAQGLI